MVKLAEGTNIVYKDADELATVINQRLTRFAGLTMAKSPARKLNRLAGQLQAKIALLRAHKPAKGMPAVPEGFIKDLDALLASVVEPKAAKGILELCDTVLSKFTSYIDDSTPQGKWLCYNAVSTFGPLGYVLRPNGRLRQRTAGHAHQEPGSTAQPATAHALPERESASSRTGDRPHQQDYGRPDQGRGPAAEEQAGRELRPKHSRPLWRKRPNRPRRPTPPSCPLSTGWNAMSLLSSDGVPMLSHEGKVREQLNDLRKIAVDRRIGTRTEVSGMTAGALKATTRTASPKSRFMTLQDLIDQVAPYATSYFDTTGHPLRVEVEMKGTKADTHFDPSQSTSPLTIAVAKVLSRAMKANPGCPSITFFSTAPRATSSSSLRCARLRRH